VGKNVLRVSILGEVARVIIAKYESMATLLIPPNTRPKGAASQSILPECGFLRILDSTNTHGSFPVICDREHQ
jgi:hypothetical protein